MLPSSFHAKDVGDAVRGMGGALSSRSMTSADSEWDKEASRGDEDAVTEPELGGESGKR